MRQNKKISFNIHIIIAFVITLAILLSPISSLMVSVASNINRQNINVISSGDILESDGIVRPQEIEEGLSRKSFEEIKGRRVTIRSPYMEVLDDSVKRTPAEPLSDIFYFIDPETGKPYSGEGSEKAYIDFSKMKNVGSDIDNALGSLTNPRYPMQGLEKGEKRYFSDFVKYMLLRQAWYYRDQALIDISNNELKKHPAADYIYGAISDSALAVKKLIISDPIYKSPMTTGLYLVSGEVVTVKVKGLKEGETIKLTTHQQDSLGYDGSVGSDINPNTEPGYQGLNSTERYFRYWDLKLIEEAKQAALENREPDYTKFTFNLQGQWRWQNQKVPCMGSIFEISSNGTHQIGSIYGGPLYLQPTSSEVEIEITGAVETPHYILGVTTKDEFEKNLRNAPGLIATLDVENGQLVGLSKYMKNCDDIEKLAYFWHSVFAINASLNGRAYNYNVTMAYDLHVPAGEAVALNASYAAQPEGWFGTCMNYEALTTSGNWGTFHELGHIQAKTYGVNWGMCSSTCKNPCEGEVWNNTLIILMYALLCNMDPRVTNIEHGEFVYPYTAVNRSMSVQDVEDYHDFNNTKGAHFDQLSLYATLIHSFGPSRFVDFFQSYQINPAYCPESRADFIYRMGLINHVNLFNWINENYHGNVVRTSFTDEQWHYLQTLPDFYPIAYRYANGIDGNETARKYEVDGKFPTIFDLSKDNIVSPKNFKIIEVTDPLYGEINYQKSLQKVTYTPPKEVCENDRFDIIVETEGGRLVSLNVNLKLLYRGTYAQVWDLNSDANPKQSVEAALNEINGRLPDRSEESNIAGKASFTAPATKRELYHLRFKFVATTAGLHEFYLKADDASEVKFYQNDENGDLIGTLSTAKDIPNYGSSYVAADLNINDTIYVDCYLVNWGGPGNLYVGVKMPNSDQIIEIPSNNIINAAVTNDELIIADSFTGWQPKFLDSIKDAPIDEKVNKEKWQILASPVAHVGDGIGATGLIDGDENSYYHSSYAGNKPQYPHTFIIDCTEEITVNYFEIVRRGTQNDKIVRFSLYACGSLNSPTDDDYKLLFSGNTTDPNNTRYRVNFPTQNIRYFKLVIEQTSGHTVIRELDAGLTVSLAQTVRPKNYEKESFGFSENSANGKLTATKKDAFYEFSFLGTGFDLFADTNLDYGSAKIYIDNKEDGIINLKDKLSFSKCVYQKHNLENKQHTVKIVTNSDAKFNISFINVDFTTPVEKRDYPSLNDDYGDENPLIFSPEWKTLVPQYKELTSIKFVNEVPTGYIDTFLRMNDYIRLYQKENDPNQIAFVYKGKILAPSECGFLFAGCNNLEEISFTNFDTTNVRSTIAMFSECYHLLKLDLSNFNLAQTSYMSTMFANCESLQELNITSFIIKEQTSLTDFFKNCDHLQKLYVPTSFVNNTINLPYQFFDENSQTLNNELTSNNAGHLLFAHDGHSFNDYIKKQDPTCIKEGIKAHFKCICGAYSLDGTNETNENLTLAALGHTFTNHIEKIDPTCVKEGLKEHFECHCGACSFDGINETDENLTIAALGHTFTNHIEKIDPTCVKEGLKEHFECHCGACSFDGINETNENLIIAALGHTFGEWEVVKEATTKEKGLKTRKCECGEIETLEIPMLTTNYLPIWLSISAVIVVIGIIFIVTLLKKKKNKKR